MMIYRTRETLIFIFIFLLSFSLKAQNNTQTIRGSVFDIDTKKEIPFATIVIKNSDPLIGTTADIDGSFRLEKVPIGRHTIEVSYIGYETKTFSNILLISGKETVLNVEIKESFHQLKEVVVEEGDKSAVNNEMALISSQKLSIEESKRYAGAINDPARLASTFAGVANEGSGNNDIIVRGNNPRFIQWKLEGIEIPNPNHFAGEGLTGGPINALNSQMLANSEFYTGAFAPQYGNALAGIFDMKLRKGNDEKRENSVSIGVLGTDITTEGPFKKEGKSSYLVNYRYSTLSLLDMIGAVDFGGVPKYQDYSFKIFLPTEKAGVFSVFGLGGLSSIDAENIDEENNDQFIEEFSQQSYLNVTGLNHFIPLSEKSYLKTTLAYSLNGSEYAEKRPFQQESHKVFHQTKLENNTIRVASTFNSKINARNQFQLGIIYTNFRFNFNNRSFDITTNQYTFGQANKGDAGLYEAFTSWKWRITEQLSTVSGLHLSKSSQNEKVVVEPRLALRYELNETQAITAGFGIHTKMASLPNHYSIVQQENGEYTQPNKNLELLQAEHYVVGYENSLNKNISMKVEAYYQLLNNIPVEAGAQGYISLINQDGLFINRNLINEGKGKNVGLELTLERYFIDNYYLIITGSIYDSKYKVQDQEWKNSRYNGNYVANALFGKEYEVGKKSNSTKTFGINSKLTLMGARRYTPIKLEESIAEGRTVYDEANAFGERAEDLFSLNLAFNYRVDKKKISHEIKLDIQNITGNEAIVDYYYNEATKEIESIPQLSLLPVLSYTVNF